MSRKLLFVLVLAFLVVSCSREDDLSSAPKQVPAEKNVEFQLYTDKTFAEERFDEAFIKVELVLLKIDKDGNESTIFEKTYDWIHFREFPTEANKILEQHKVTYDKNSEVVYAGYGLYTKIDGFLASEGTSFSLAPRESTHKIVVRL